MSSFKGFSWAELSSQLKEPLLFNHSLSRFTSWRVGGCGEVVFIPDSIDDISRVLSLSPSDVPVTWLGLGSNVLIPDEGIQGLVIVTQGSVLSHMKVEEQMLYAEAGVSCGQLARYSARQHFQGLEFLAGIPGTVGGALRMNAGCYGAETWDNVIQVETIDRKGIRHSRHKSQFNIAYREVTLPAEEYFLAGYFQVQHGNKEESLLKIKHLLDKRNQAQPTHLPNCGSVFKNPPGYFAAALIESCGLKGYRIGGAQVSEKHANFIVNTGNASSSDIVNLIAYVKKHVNEKHNIVLEQEVKVLS